MHENMKTYKSSMYDSDRKIASSGMTGSIIVSLQAFPEHEQTAHVSGV